MDTYVSFFSVFLSVDFEVSCGVCLITKRSRNTIVFLPIPCGQPGS